MIRRMAGPGRGLLPVRQNARLGVEPGAEQGHSRAWPRSRVGPATLRPAPTARTRRPTRTGCPTAGAARRPGLSEPRAEASRAVAAGRTPEPSPRRCGHRGSRFKQAARSATTSGGSGPDAGGAESFGTRNDREPPRRGTRIERLGCRGGACDLKGAMRPPGVRGRQRGQAGTGNARQTRPSSLRGPRGPRAEEADAPTTPLPRPRPPAVPLAPRPTPAVLPPCPTTGRASPLCPTPAPVRVRVGADTPTAHLPVADGPSVRVGDTGFEPVTSSV